MHHVKVWKGLLEHVKSRYTFVTFHLHLAASLNQMKKLTLRFKKDLMEMTIDMTPTVELVQQHENSRANSGDPLNFQGSQDSFISQGSQENSERFLELTVSTKALYKSFLCTNYSGNFLSGSQSANTLANNRNNSFDNNTSSSSVMGLASEEALIMYVRWGQPSSASSIMTTFKIPHINI